MKHSVMILLLGFLSLYAYDDTLFRSNLEQFNYEEILNQYNLINSSNEENSANEESSFSRGQFAFGLYQTGGKQKSWLEVSISAFSLALTMDNSEEQLFEINRTLAHCYLGLINDAATWMKYRKKHELYLKKALEIDPDDCRLQLIAAKSMMRFPSPLGDEDDGEALLFSLLEQYEDSTFVLMSVADYYQDQNEIDSSELYFRKVLTINSNHRYAREELDKIVLMSNELAIRFFIVDSAMITSSKRVLEKVDSFRGTRLSMDSYSEIQEKLVEIPPIESATLTPQKVGDSQVDIFITVEEEDTRGVVAMVDANLSNDYFNDLVPGFMPTLFYMNENVKGTGMALEFLTVVVYNQLDVTYRGLFDTKFLNANLLIESMILSEENDDYVMGKQITATRKSSYHNALLGLGVSLPFGMDIYGRYWAQLDLYKDLENMITPPNQVTHELMADITISTAGELFSPLKLKEGYHIYLNPYIQFKPDFRAWGDPDSLFTHNSSPAYGIRAQAGYYRNLGRRFNLESDVHLLWMENAYESSRFRIGRKNLMDDYSISGYIPEELVFDKGVLTNIKYTWIVRPEQFLLYGRYDFLYDSDQEKLFNSVALGAGIALPWNMELKSEFGIALDAERDSGLGYNFSMRLSKMMFF